MNFNSKLGNFNSKLGTHPWRKLRLACLSKLYQCLEPAVFTGLAQVTTVKVSLSSAGQNQRVDSVMGKTLKEQAFATPDMVAELVQKVNTAIQQVLPPMMVKMKLHLQNHSTRTILFNT
ncbi:hypothetical protein Q3G72_033207 [Acer saccharum]|nr:hypothetical protein Q3G72_033207 [Acer saccharum]